MTTNRVSILCAALVPMLLGAGEYKFVPTGASGSHAVNTFLNEITLQGGGQTVTLDLMLRGWDPDLDGNPELGAWQGTVDANGYLGANSSVPNIIDLSPVGFDDINTRQLGGYQITNRCFDLEGDGLHNEPCGPPATGPFITEAECQAAGGLFCVTSQDFVHGCCDPIAAVGTGNITCQTPQSCPYSWGAAPGPTASNGAVDDNTFRYGGTLVLDVPVGATGTYSIGFTDNTDLTFMNDFNSGSIGGLTLTPALITVACGSDLDCDDGLTCTNNTCNGGQCESTILQNRCLIDGVCFAGSSSNPLNDCEFCDSRVNPTSWTPRADGLDCNDDGNECTNDFCSNGACTHPFASFGTLCGDGTSSECDDEDSCDGNGTCLANNVPDGTACTDDGDVCTSDACAAGVCEHPINLFDGNCDGEINLLDFALFMICFTDTDPTPVDCEAFDVEPDDDVDLADLAAFEEALTK